MLFSQLCQDLLGDGLRFLSPCLHVVELLQYSFVRRVCEVVVDDGLHAVVRILVGDQGGDDIVVGLTAGLKDDLPVFEAFVGFSDVVRDDDALLS